MINLKLYWDNIVQFGLTQVCSRAEVTYLHECLGMRAGREAKKRTVGCVLVLCSG